MFQLLFNDIIHYLLSIIFVAIHISNAPIKIKRLQHLLKYMKKWRNNLAHINQAIDTYFKTYYKVVDYHIKKPNLRVTDITWRPYGYRKWLRRTTARRRCIKYIKMHKTHTKPSNNIIEVKASTNKGTKRLHFDSDSYDILVDNCCSQSITNCITDYITPPKTSGMKIKGFDGSTTTTKVGTVQWKIADDDGKIHRIKLPNTYYSEQAESRLLSPQHWAQTANNGRGTRCLTYHDAIILEWNDRKYRRTIPLSQHSRNVGVITSPIGIKSYLQACSILDHTHPNIAFPATIDKSDLHIITDDEEEQESTLQQDHPTKATKIPTSSSPVVEIQDDSEEEEQEDRAHPIQTDFTKQPFDIRDETPIFKDEQQEYMHWHYKLNHASHFVMIKMAHMKMLPRGISQILKRMEEHN